MKTSTTLLAALTATTTTLALPQASPPDNTVVKQTQKFHLRALNIGTDPSIFGNDSYAGFYHVYAGQGGNIVALTSLERSPEWYLEGTELFLQSGGARLKFDSSPELAFGVDVVQEGSGFTNYTLNIGGGSQSFGNFTRDGELYVSHMQVAQNAPSYGCKGDVPATESAVVLKYGDMHVDPVTPEGCSEILLKAELI